MRPPNSPDLNPVDYAIWSVIQLNAGGNILIVHYKDMKCDVSFSLGSVSTLFGWGGHFCHVCKMFPLVYNGAKIVQIDQDFPELWSQNNVLPSFYGSQCTMAHMQPPKRYKISREYGRHLRQQSKTVQMQLRLTLELIFVKQYFANLHVLVLVILKI